MTLPTPRSPGDLLPIVGQPAAPEERSDAARNRKLLLDAARALVAAHGVAALTMDELARRAGVGKGTVFRRFGSRAGLMMALLDHSEQQFQGAYLAGPPPLGPGGDPVDRLIAYGRARLDLTEIHGEIKAAGAKLVYSTNVYQTDVTHVAMLLRQAGTPGADRLLAEMLLAAIDAPLVLYQTRVRNIEKAEIAEQWARLVRRVAGPDTPSAGERLTRVTVV